MFKAIYLIPSTLFDPFHKICLSRLNDTIQKLLLYLWEAISINHVSMVSYLHFHWRCILPVTGLFYWTSLFYNHILIKLLITPEDLNNHKKSYFIPMWISNSYTVMLKGTESIYYSPFQFSITSNTRDDHKVGSVVHYMWNVPKKCIHLHVFHNIPILSDLMKESWPADAEPYFYM